MTGRIAIGREYSESWVMRRRGKLLRGGRKEHADRTIDDQHKDEGRQEVDCRKEQKGCHRSPLMLSEKRQERQAATIAAPVISASSI